MKDTIITDKKIKWHKVLNNEDELPEGRVKTVTAGKISIALSHVKDKICALDNACPHQGGPLGEGSIEKGWLRCPWHGWDFNPCTGESPGSHGDSLKTFPVKKQSDGVYVGIEEEAPSKKTVSDVMIETMINWGVTHVFGMVGHSNLGLGDAIRKQVLAGNLKYIGIRHEGAASFAASAYAKLTGKPAACLSIAGPGATNLLTGLWDAKVDRVPILALTGQVDTQVLGPGAFQEVDLASAYNSVASFSQTVLAGSKHTELMSLALKHAILERDVAHLIFPNEVQELPLGDKVKAKTSEGRIPDLHISPSHSSLKDALRLIKERDRPCIIVGHGARNSMDKIIALAEKLKAPVLTTFKGKGLIPDSHPLACGVLGRSGTPIASWFMNKSNLIVVFGASFSNHTGISSYKDIIQVDYDIMALSRFHKIKVPIWGEISTTADLLIANLKKLNVKDRSKEIAERWNIWRTEKSKRVADKRGKGLNSAEIFEALSAIIPNDAVIAVDVGNNAYSFGRYFECRSQSVLMSGYLGSIGFGYPAAMGAWAAAPDRAIVAITGDGGFGQYLAEVTTAVKYNIPVKHILLNNSELGKISKEQRADELEVWETELHNPNFAKFAENCGALGIRVTKKDQLMPALKKLFKHPGPGMVEIISDVMLI